MTSGIRSKLARFATLSLLAGLVGAVAASAANANPFTKLKGNWRGGGTVTPIGDSKERVACRVNYGFRGTSVVQTMNCAGADYRISASATLQISSTNPRGKVSGSWQERNYGVGGGAAGSFSDNRVNVFITGSKFNGRMTINVSGSRHTVRISQVDSGTGKTLPVATISFRR